MTPTDIIRAAQALYEAGQTPRPAWDHLSDATQAYWRDKLSSRDGWLREFLNDERILPLLPTPSPELLAVVEDARRMADEACGMPVIGIDPAHGEDKACTVVAEATPAGLKVRSINWGSR